MEDLPRHRCCKVEWVINHNGGHRKVRGSRKGFVVQKHSSKGFPVLMPWWGEPGKVYHWTLRQVSSAGSSGAATGAVAWGSGDGGSGTAGTQTHQLTERQSPAPADSPWGPLWMVACPCRGGIWRSGDRQLHSSEHEQRRAFACSHKVTIVTWKRNHIHWNFDLIWQSK